ncbi:transmembrane amino acid transporter protein-domain-containing protein [Gongronella butleri]|nr:transmembrane amino acid transporter protein-domain-containing protein [Gongronella butleri]
MKKEITTHPPTTAESIKTIEKEPAFIGEDVKEEACSSIQQRGSGGFLIAFFNVTCVVAGTGTLGLPKAFAEGGWIGVLILMLSYGMAVYSGIVLIRCLYYKPGERLANFKAVGRAAFGKPGYGVSALLHFLNLFGCPALYLVLAAGNMKSLTAHANISLSHEVWVIIIGTFLLIPSLILKTLHEVTVVSSIGAVCTMIAVFIIMVESPMYYAQHPNEPVVRDAVIWSGFPSALATIAFSFGGNNTYPHVEHALKNPQQWSYALTAGLSTCTLLYIMTSVPAYFAFGANAQSPIYNSLPDGVGKTIAIVVMTIHVILAIPIYTTSFSLEFETSMRLDEGRLGKFGAWCARALVRTVTMCGLCIIAIATPFFDDFMGLLGAISNCGLVFLLPIICYLKLTGTKNKPWYELAFCALTIGMGLTGLVFGSIASITKLVRDFASNRPY